VIEKDRTNRKIRDMLNYLITEVRFDCKTIRRGNRNMRYPGYF